LPNIQPQPATKKKIMRVSVARAKFLGSVIVFRRRDRELNRVGTQEPLLIFLKKAAAAGSLLELECGTAVERVRRI
jgi:hypothetical protein